MAFRNRLLSLAFPAALEAFLRDSRARNCVAVLMYHEVLPSSFEAPHWCVACLDRFRQQIAYLAGTSDLLTLDDVVERFKEPQVRPSSRPAVALTFDDGYAGNLTHVLPVLEEFGVPATIYVATAMVEQGDCHWYDKVALALLERPQRNTVIETSAGTIKCRTDRLTASRRWAAVQAVLTALKKLPLHERMEVGRRLWDSVDIQPLRMLTPADVRKLSQHSLIQIGCHTHGHELLDQVPLDEVRHSIHTAQNLLEAWTDLRPRHFSYPNGNHSAAAKAVVHAAGFVSAVTTQSRLSQPGDDVYAIPRIGIGRFDGLNLFRAKVSGLAY